MINNNIENTFNTKNHIRVILFESCSYTVCFLLILSVIYCGDKYLKSTFSWF